MTEAEAGRGFDPRDMRLPNQAYNEVPLVEAIRKENLKQVKELVKKGVNLRREYEFRHGRAPALHIAAAINQKTDIIKFLLDQGHFSVDERTGSENMTALHWAAAHSYSEKPVKYLLGRGADREAKDVNGCTPLHQAAGKNYLGQIVQVLVAAGGNVNARDNKGQTPLMHTTQRKTVNRPLLVALLKVKADVNLVDKDSRTALHYAVRSRHGDSVSEFVVFKLLENGADANLQDAEGWSALHYAAGRSDTEQTDWLIQLLLEKRVDPNARTKSGLTPLHNAARVATRKTVVTRLIQEGAEVNSLAADGSSPLLCAAHQNSCVDVLQALLDAGASLDLRRPGSEQTALHLACIQGTNEAVKLNKLACLLKAGADPMSRDRDHYKASEYQKLTPSVRQLLRSAEANTGSYVKQQERPPHPTPVTTGLPDPLRSSQLVLHQTHPVVSSASHARAEVLELCRFIGSVHMEPEAVAFALFSEYAQCDIGNTSVLEEVAQRSKLYLKWWAKEQPRVSKGWSRFLPKIKGR